MVRIQKVTKWLTPTAINTYLRCPRKYYYRYIRKLPTKTNIHLVRGCIVHEVLDLFFKLRVYSKSGETYGSLRQATLALFEATWDSHKDQLDQLHMKPQDLEFYRDDSRKMIINWLHVFLKSPLKDPNPKTEVKMFSKKHKVWGVIDVVQNTAAPQVIDYKTSKSMKMIDDYRLQLSIYALLYFEKYGRLPHRVGIHFLKFKDGLKLFEPNEKALRYAVDKINKVRNAPATTNVADYPCTCGGWCHKDFTFENG